ncbi:hypothetical protein FGIG_07761 [Fasciola gigantica]|uniref:C2H2-type domain-containing protein n=1 Tax=Fasciola gigantica TaxID=46835 RepID=A0A504Z9N1_FASGI|nr:hypothetical protein FGIG_07761 [Fasciola gigantica]
MGEHRAQSLSKTGGFEITRETIIEAKDNYGTWYPAKVLAVVDDKVSFCYNRCDVAILQFLTSSRYDTWYPINSGKIRPLKRLNTANKSMTKSQPVAGSSISNGLKSAPNPSLSKQFELNTYVMASWKNNYEYLAEIIAHRRRQGGRSEYKLRYVWDRVVEWTPSVRLRKATQFEIDYVLKFCREHSGGAAAKFTSVQRSPATENARVAAASTRKRTETVMEVSSSTTRLQSKRKDAPDRQTQVICGTDHDHPTPAPTSIPAEEPKTNTLPLFDKVEHDDMLYDRSVAQFHEACRKRRELKRRAIETEKNSLNSTPGLTGKGKTNGAKRLPSSSTSSHSTSKPKNRLSVSPDVMEKPSKVPRLSEANDPVLMSSQLPAIVKKIESPVQEVTCTSPTKKQLSPVHNTSKSKNSQLTISPKRPLTVPPPPVSTSKPIKPDPEKITKSKHTSMPTCLRVAHSVPSKSSPPVTYPCPYCPRQLRHSKLLAAHISNYHKDIRPSSKSRLSMRSRAQSSVKHLAPNDLSERTARTNPAIDRTGRIPTGVVHGPPNFTRLVACHRCDTRTYATDKQTGLVQCRCCMCWVHRACYNLIKSPNKSVELLCDGCLFADRSARYSRMYEPYTQWMQTGQFPWDCGSSTSSTNETDPLRHLIAKTSAIVNWTHHLRPLLRSGWSALDRTKLSVTPFPVRSSKTGVTPPPPSSLLPPPRRTPLAISKSDHTLASVLNPGGGLLPSVDSPRGPVGETKPSDFSGQDPSTSSEDQVNRLYMELRGLAFDPSESGNPEAIHSRALSSNPTVAEDPAFSPPDSVCATNCWTLVSEDVNYCAADVSNTDSNEVVSSSQVLSGFLQDLGPNVMPELADLGADAMGSEAYVDDFFKSQLADGRPESQPPSVSAHTPPISSVSDTPTKGLGALLSSPSAVTTALQATLGHIPTNGFSVNPTVKDSPCNELEKKWQSRDKHNSTSVLDESIIECVSRPRNPASAPPVLTDFVTASLIDDLPAAHLFAPPNQLTTSPSKLILGPEGSLTPMPNSYKSANSSSTPMLHPVDVDWISANATSETSSMPSVTSLPCVLSRCDSVTKETTLGDPTTASVYDELGLYPQQQQQRVPDVIFPDDFAERLCTANQQLDDLDERILTPLELILTVMESRMDELNAELALLEHQQFHGEFVGCMQSRLAGSFHDTDDRTEQEDIYGEEIMVDSDGLTTGRHLDADTVLTSPLCSSSSSTFSLSPHRNQADEARTVSSGFPRDSLYKSLIHPGQSPSVRRRSYPMENDLADARAKRAARKLYQFTHTGRPVRSWQLPDPSGILNSSTRAKSTASYLFPTRSRNAPPRM